MAGEFRSEDLIKLFMYLRQQASQHRVVREVAHFLAHPERDKGMLPELMSDTFVNGTWVFSSMGPNKKRHSLDDLPANMIQVLRVMRKRIDARTLKRDTGMNAGSINATLESLCSALCLNARGTIHAVRELTPAELVLLKQLTNKLVVTPAFSQKDLFLDFRDALRAAGLLTANEQLPAHISPWLMLVAIEAMHQATMQTTDHNTTLEAGINHDGFLDVSMSMIVAHYDPPRPSVAFPAVATELRPTEWWTGPNLPGARWDFPIEVTPEPRLRRLPG